MDKSVDVLIIGGGLTGSALMLALKETKLNVLLVDTKPFNASSDVGFDARSLALSPASQRILEMLNIWPQLNAFASPINAIHISEQARFGRAYLQNEERTPLGYVVEMQHISRAFNDLLNHKHCLMPARIQSLNHEQGLVTLEHEGRLHNIKAQLIVAADGTHSQVRALCGLKAAMKDYQQKAIVANIGLHRAHQQVAYERFTKHGPLAMLPMIDNRAALVWSLPPFKADEMMCLDDRTFLSALQNAFGYRLGRLARIGTRSVFPLRQVLMTEKTIGSVVFVGNAAQTLHPVAGQGFNLGLRDVAILAQCIVQKGLDKAMLKAYVALRRHDQNAITRFTNGLVDLFTQQAIPGLGLARGLGLVAFDNYPPLKRLLSRYASGYAGVIPDLVCHIPLVKELE